MRTLHFEMVASVLRHRLELAQMGQGDKWTVIVIVKQFADEFERRAEGFQRAKFYGQCGLTIDMYR